METEQPPMAADLLPAIRRSPEAKPLMKMLKISRNTKPCLFIGSIFLLNRENR
jgi:hypothetical protein